MSSAVSPGRRRGFWPAVALAILLVATIPAEFIANDRPLLVSYVGYLYSPVAYDYPETKFGGDFETTADFTDGYLRFQIERHGWMLWPLVPFSPASAVIDLSGPAPTPPSHRNWLGTDAGQRDVLARLIYGTQSALFVGLAVAAATVLARRRIARLFYLPPIAVAVMTAVDFAKPSDRPSFGGLLRDGLAHPNAPWLAVSGLVGLAAVLISLILLGRALRTPDPV